MDLSQIIGIIFAVAVGLGCLGLIVYAIFLKKDQIHDTLHSESSDWWMNRNQSIDALETLPSKQAINQNKLWEKFTNDFNVDLTKPLEDANFGNDVLLKTFSIIDNKTNTNQSACLILSGVREDNRTAIIQGLLKLYERVFLPYKKHFVGFINAPQVANSKEPDLNLLDENGNLTKKAVSSLFPNAITIIEQDHPYLFKITSLNKNKQEINRFIVDGLKWVFDLLQDTSNEVVFYWNIETKTLYRYVTKSQELTDLSIYEKQA